MSAPANNPKPSDTMSRRSLLKLALGAPLGLAALRLGGCGRSDAVPSFPIADRPRRGGTDVTFYVAADTHLGVEGMATMNRIQVDALNALPGRDWPWPGAGRVGTPRTVLVAGDLTENGLDEELAAFEALYGHRGGDGRLQWPVHVCHGNHDEWVPRSYEGRLPVRELVRRRHGGLNYSWDFDDVHFACVGKYPDRDGRWWLARDLAAAGAEVPVVVWFHFNIVGPYSDWWTDQEKRQLAEILRPFNVVGIFYGHWHSSQHAVWEGFDLFNVGSPRHRMHSFAAVRITDEAMQVASWNWDRSAWQWEHRKAINAAG